MSDPNTLAARWESPGQDQMVVTFGVSTVSHVTPGHWLWEKVEQAAAAGALTVAAYDPALDLLLLGEG